MSLKLGTSLHLPRTQSSASFVFDIPTDRTLELVHRPLSQARTPAFQPSPKHNTHTHSYLVISGGTGCNAICSAFGEDVSYVLPVSDNGGSSSEIIRVLGGPSIGDIRSRLIRLIPQAPLSSPIERIRRLLSHRLPGNTSEQDARELWREIVEGRSELWHGIPADRKETIRGFLVYFDGEVLKRANKRFSFKNGSIGNFLLTGAHLFFRSVPSAIFLFSSITGSRADILPVLVTNHTVTIAAELENGQTLVGQCEISHPSPTLVSPQTATKISNFQIHAEDNDGSEDSQETVEEDDWVADAMGAEDTGSSVHNVQYTKENELYQPLEASIRRLFYINQYGQEIYPSPNPTFLRNLNSKSVLVYACGSLFTSIVPCLALRGVATAIAASRSLKAKVLLLNARNDRETEGYSAADYIKCIANILNHHDALSSCSENGWPPSAFITHLVYLKNTSVHVDEAEIAALGVRCVEVEALEGSIYDASCVEYAMDVIMSTIEVISE